MTTLTIDAARKGAKAVFSVRDAALVVTFPDFDAELVFVHSGGSLWQAVTLAGGFGMALAEAAASRGDELVAAAVATEKETVN